MVDNEHEPKQGLSYIGLSWNDIFLRGPALASIFAFSYVIGYFFALDISWFAVFSIAEHLVFALRALPIAIGAFVLFLIGVSLSEGKHQWTWPFERERLLSSIINIGWALILIVAAVILFLGAYIASAFSFAGIAGGVIFFHTMLKPRPLFVHILYWGTNLTVCCFLLGFLSGELSKSGYSRSLPLVQDMCIISGAKPTSNIGNVSELIRLKGHVLFSGANGVLFITVQKEVRLIRWDTISDISEGHSSKCSDMPR
jgi:hypothetical protein